ncbi:MAG TPA: peptide chain release factor N(5)-glutamine methyltransferase [Dehalococcoidia bacterium]|nr:peptide chain release factor N(5)-glutamine methyltransferase [Dehalococcoidia bacterium]
MTISEALREGTRLLRGVRSEEPKLEAEMLLMHALKIDRVGLYQRLRQPLKPQQRRRYQRLLERRQAHEPTAYILGTKEFYGLEFEVSRAALIPRPETETLVELVVAYVRNRADERLVITDIGTGSGVIAVSLAFRLMNARITATDASKRALALAQRNAERHGAAERIEFGHGNLLTPLNHKPDVIAANLPYVTTAEWEALSPEITDHEPKGALHGGADGLRYIRRLLKRAPGELRPGGAIFLEIGGAQGAVARFLARRSFPESDIEIAPDLAGRDRVLCVYS